MVCGCSYRADRCQPKTDRPILNCLQKSIGLVRETLYLCVGVSKIAPTHGEAWVKKWTALALKGDPIDLRPLYDRNLRPRSTRPAKRRRNRGRYAVWLVAQTQIIVPRNAHPEILIGSPNFSAREEDVRCLCVFVSRITIY